MLTKQFSYQQRLAEWRPDTRPSPQEISEDLHLELAPSEQAKKSPSSVIGSDTDEIFMPKSSENPVIASLKERGLYKKSLGSGKHEVTCPWVHEHTDELDTGAAYFEPDEAFPLGGFCCQHSHGEKYRTPKFLNYLNIDDITARHKSTIRVIAGDLDKVVDTAEKVLVEDGRFYQSGNLIVTAEIDHTTGNPSVVHLNAPSLMKVLAGAANWTKFDGRAKKYVRCDPPMHHINILFNSTRFKHLLPLVGLARQPYFRESDNELVSQPGYDRESKLLSVFDPEEFVFPEPTPEEAKKALALLKDLISEFHFATDSDVSAALSAFFTAATRPTLPHAPGYHVKAPTSGSGKTYLCDVIGAFTGPAANAKVSYPTTSEEATKVILSLLLSNPPVIEFDDLNSDLIPHGVIKRMLTSENITDRILGISKTATVSTRTLFLSSGNNVGPLGDLLRRVLTINLDPRCATPATLNYKNNPVEMVRRNRGKYVSAVLTIIQAWHNAGSPRADVPNIATYSGTWSDYCRQPLIWLGLADPAMALIDQITHDPDAELLKDLMSEWNHLFGSKPMTVRKVVEYANNESPNLLDAIRELPVCDRGEINPSKLGWFLKKNANRIIGNYKFQESSADGRKAWSLIYIPPNLPQPRRR